MRLPEAKFSLKIVLKYGFCMNATANPPKSDDKYAPKSVQLVRVSSFRSDFLKNPYFRYYDCRFCPLDQFKLTDLSF